MKEHTYILNECLGDTLVTATFPVVIPDDVDFDSAYNQIAQLSNKTGNVSNAPVDLIFSANDKEVKDCKLNLSSIRLVDPYEQSLFDESILN